MSRLAVVAITHQRASLSVLECVALDSDAATTLAHHLIDMPGTDEVVVLSTCNRTEIYLSGAAPDPTAALDALVAGAPATGEPITDCAEIAFDDDASMHLFRVTAGLESRIVGEHQILTQVRVAIAAATAAGTAGSQLTSLFRFAVAGGRRARRAAGQRVVPSLAALSVDVALGLQSAPAMSTLVVGAGAMAAAASRELTARHLDYIVCARRPSQAIRLARRPDHVLDLADLHAGLLDVDVAMFATGARHPLLSAADVVDLMARRNGRSLTILDLSLPRNVDADAGLVDGVHLFDLEDLNATNGDLELRSGSRAVEEEHLRFRLWQAGQVAGATITRLRASVTEQCRLRLEEATGSAAATTQEIDRTARMMAGRLLHQPIMRIKHLVASGDEHSVAALVADVHRTVGDATYRVAS